MLINNVMISPYMYIYLLYIHIYIMYSICIDLQSFFCHKFLENDEVAERKPLKIELILKGNISLSPTKSEVYTTVLSSLVQPQFSVAMLFGIIGVAILLVGSPFVFAFKQDALKQMTPQVGKGLLEWVVCFFGKRFFLIVLICILIYVSKSKWIYCMYYIYIYTLH